MSLRRTLPLVLLPALSTLGSAQGDPAVVARIIEEGKNNSHVWETLEYLSHEIGPRLTGSTNLARANAWTRDEFRRLGLTSCEMLKWGDVPVRFDRGPCSARMIAPSEREFQFTARSWSAGTDGPVRGPVVKMPTNEEELAAVADQLEGAWVITESTRSRRRRSESDEEREVREAKEAITNKVKAAGIAGLITGSRNDLVITSGSWRDLTMDNLPTEVSVQVTRTDFDAVLAELDAGEQVEVEINLAHYFTEGPFPVYNTVAEIRGSEKPEEVIILSAHLDSWDGPGSQGTQDNGTGSSVMLEAARILMASGVQPKRTIRFCLWTGEEQGLYGSKGYVAGLSDEEKALVSACLVDDGGTNYQGGLVCVASMSPMLNEAIAPLLEAFPEFDIANSVQDRMPRGGSSDHASFNQVGIPGFFWIEKGSGGQEDTNYRFVHHTQHDTTRYAVPEYLVQSATASAVTAYNLAQAETMLPRESEESEGDAGGQEQAPDPSFMVAAGGLTGPWKAEMVGADAPDLAFTLDLQISKDGRVRGMLKSQMGEASIAKGTWNAETKSANFTASSEMGELAMSATLKEDGVTGTIKLGEEFAFKAQRLPLKDAPINGAWKVYLPDFDVTVDLSLALGEDDVLRGWYKSTSSDSALYKGKWDAQESTLTFEYDYPHAGRLPVVAKYADGKLTGTIGENTGFTAKLAKTDG